ncbi:MAG: hypothetical protein ACLRWM_04760 [Streptococcus sp.]
MTNSMQLSKWQLRAIRRTTRQLEYNEALKEITRFKGLGDKLDDKRKEIGRIYKDPLTEFESKLATSLEPLNAS